MALKYAVRMNGVDELIMMKSDVLNDFDTIQVATAYRIGGATVDWFPFESNEAVEPVYSSLPGWKADITGVRRYEDFPQAFRDYVSFIERETGCPIRIISVGPDREEIVVR